MAKRFTNSVRAIVSNTISLAGSNLLTRDANTMKRHIKNLGESIKIFRLNEIKLTHSEILKASKINVHDKIFSIKIKKENPVCLGLSCIKI